MKSRTIVFLCGLAVVMLLSALNPPPTGAHPGARAAFDPSMTLAGVLPPGSLGLPGEPVTWEITVTNAGTASGTQVVITDLLPGELRIDRAEAALGGATITGQEVEFTIPVLNPGQTVEMRIYTTVVRSPVNGIMLNQASLVASGPGGPVVRKAVAEVFVPTSLPATGYPPAEDMPGHGEPSASQIALVALGVVLIAAVVVWYRGRSRWQPLF
jgi:uncharacterized repeat protein (TIGR01451 family)